MDTSSTFQFVCALAGLSLEALGVEQFGSYDGLLTFTNDATLLQHPVRGSSVRVWVCPAVAGETLGDPGTAPMPHASRRSRCN